ncbi:MAG: hypothetical protein IH874_06560 [Candidatus Dadabacteria bacterium]|nr:hypothetical protein [Candidatus Dadabacteria bacterium]
MSESQSHKRAKGKGTQKEVPISGKRRLDALSGNTAIEVERSGTDKGLDKALSRLKSLPDKRKLLKVPQKDMEKAEERARKKRIGVTVSNLGGTKRKRIRG